jgi:site-specific DNA-methyltransferase (adenine-specific)
LTNKLLGSLELNRIYQRDCLEGMAMIPDKSIDMILCDLPYGTTACKWDTIIPFEPLWEQYERIIKDNGAIVLTSTQPFTSALIMSNTKSFKYCWTWDKVHAKGHLVAKIRPMQQTEDICVFGKGKIFYFPIMEKAEKAKKTNSIEYSRTEIMGGEITKKRETKISEYRYPKTLLRFSNASQKDKLHPTQKPVDLFAYLIRTYTNEGELVLDNCMGSGTTAVAAVRSNRNFIGFETEPDYVRIANQRLEAIKDELAERKLTEE